VPFCNMTDLDQHSRNEKAKKPTEEGSYRPARPGTGQTIEQLQEYPQKNHRLGSSLYSYH
jgi:hypothetical protein